MNINYNNYEEYLVEYLEGELTPAQEAEVRQFLEQNPELKDELVLLQQTFLDPGEEPLVYQNKASLMREERGRVLKLSASWGVVGAIAAAAVVILAIAIVLMLQKSAPETGNSFANNSDVPAQQDLIKKDNSNEILQMQRTEAEEEMMAASSQEVNRVIDGNKEGGNGLAKNNYQNKNKKAAETFAQAEKAKPAGNEESTVEQPVKAHVKPVEVQGIAANEINVEKLKPQKINKRETQPEETAIAQNETAAGINQVKEKVSLFELATEPKGLLAIGEKMWKRVTGDKDPVVVEKHEVEGKKRFNVKLESDQFVLSADFSTR